MFFKASFASFLGRLETKKTPAKIKIPAGTQAGKIFRLKGKGLPSVQTYGRGDELIHINIWTYMLHNSDCPTNGCQLIKLSPVEDYH